MLTHLPRGVRQAPARRAGDDHTFLTGPGLGLGPFVFGNERCSEGTAMRSRSRYRSPVGLGVPRSRGRVAGDEVNTTPLPVRSLPKPYEELGCGSGLGGRTQSRRSRTRRLCCLRQSDHRKNRLDNPGNCYLRTKSALVRVGQTNTLILFVVAGPTSPTSSHQLENQSESSISATSRVAVFMSRRVAICSRLFPGISGLS